MQPCEYITLNERIEADVPASGNFLFHSPSPRAHDAYLEDALRRPSASCHYMRGPAVPSDQRPIRCGIQAPLPSPQYPRFESMYDMEPGSGVGNCLAATAARIPASIAALVCPASARSVRRSV